MKQVSLYVLFKSGEAKANKARLGRRTNYKQLVWDELVRETVGLVDLWIDCVYILLRIRKLTNIIAIHVNTSVIKLFSVV